MAQAVLSNADKTLLTRPEVRKLFRINESTIDRWVERGRLEPVGTIPDTSSGGRLKVRVLAICDAELDKKLKQRLRGGDYELLIASLPAKARRELLRGSAVASTPRKPRKGKGTRKAGKTSAKKKPTKKAPRKKTKSLAKKAGKTSAKKKPAKKAPRKKTKPLAKKAGKTSAKKKPAKKAPRKKTKSLAKKAGKASTKKKSAKKAPREKTKSLAKKAGLSSLEKGASKKAPRKKPKSATKKAGKSSVKKKAGAKAVREKSKPVPKKSDPNASTPSKAESPKEPAQEQGPRGADASEVQSPKTSQPKVAGETTPSRQPLAVGAGHFPALQSIAEASDRPEIAEALWGEEMLGILHEAAESLSAEADRLARDDRSMTGDGQLNQAEPHSKSISIADLASDEDLDLDYLGFSGDDETSAEGLMAIEWEDLESSDELKGDSGSSEDSRMTAEGSEDTKERSPLGDPESTPPSSPPKASTSSVLEELMASPELTDTGKTDTPSTANAEDFRPQPGIEEVSEQTVSKAAQQAAQQMVDEVMEAAANQSPETTPFEVVDEATLDGSWLQDMDDEDIAQAQESPAVSDDDKVESVEEAEAGRTDLEPPTAPLVSDDEAEALAAGFQLDPEARFQESNEAPDTDDNQSSAEGYTAAGTSVADGADVETGFEEPGLSAHEVPARESVGSGGANVVDRASKELDEAGIDLEDEEDQGPQIIDEEEVRDWTPSDRASDALEHERMVLEAELAEVKSLQQANWERMEARLSGIEDQLEGFRLDGFENPQIQRTLEEVRTNVIIGQSKRDILAASMSMISDNVHELRSLVSTTNKAALASAKTVQHLSEGLAKRANAAVGRRGTTSSKATPVLVLGVGVLMLTWTLLFYMKTGNLYWALAGLVIANLAGCATILLGRTESD